MSQRRKIKRHKSCETHRVPSNDSGESRSIAARIRPRRDVIQAREAAAVQPGVEEAKRLPSGREQVVIQQGDDARRGLYVGSQQGARGWRMQMRSPKGGGCRTGVEQLVPVTNRRSLLRMIRKFTACRAISGTPRPPALHKITKSEDASGRVTVANALVKAVILVAEVLEEGRHDLSLVGLPRKVSRETATGDNCRLLRVSRRAADASDKGTCENRGQCGERSVPAPVPAGRVKRTS